VLEVVPVVAVAGALPGVEGALDVMGAIDVTVGAASGPERSLLGARAVEPPAPSVAPNAVFSESAPHPGAATAATARVRSSVPNGKPDTGPGRRKRRAVRMTRRDMG
jgi:hypothetical protein